MSGIFDVVTCLMCFYRSTGLKSKVVFQASITFRESSQPSYSLIFYGSEPFKPEEQLLSAEGVIFLITNLVTLLGMLLLIQS